MRTCWWSLRLVICGSPTGLALVRSVSDMERDMADAKVVKRPEAELPPAAESAAAMACDKCSVYLCMLDLPMESKSREVLRLVLCSRFFVCAPSCLRVGRRRARVYNQPRGAVSQSPPSSLSVPQASSSPAFYEVAGGASEQGALARSWWPPAYAPEQTPHAHEVDWAVMA